MTKKEFVLIPYYVHEVLNRNKLPINSVTDLAVIKPILSANDLISIYTLQSYFNALVGTEQYSPLYNVWSDSVKNNPELSKYLNNIVTTLSSDQSFHNDVHNRLFSNESRSSTYTEAFKICDLGPELFGIVIYPGFFVSDKDKKQQKDLIDGMLIALYMYQTHSEVASNLLFHRYLKLLGSE